MTVNTFLFDLDGTLIDTAPDLAWCLNFLLVKDSIKPLSLETIRPLVSHGSLEILKLGFNRLNDNELKSKQKEFISLYQKHIAQKSCLFEGLLDIINKVPTWGVVTNKPTHLTHQLLKELNLKPAVIVCGDTLEKAKPNPEPLFYACEKLSKNIDDCIFIGDDEKDILAAKNAKMKSIAVTYGYGKDPHTWGADWVIDQPKELAKWI
jgi:phosphoglycolate phosphatase